MSQITYSQYTRLSDAAERRRMIDALSCGEPTSFADTVKRIYSGLKSAVVATARVIVEVNRILNESRQKASRVTNSDW